MGDRENKREKGSEKEALAAAYLEARGVKILEHNFRSRRGEVDLVGRDEGYLIFVEVKYRKDLTKGSPEEAVGIAKQRKICEVSDYYRLLHGIPASVPVRYDVVAMLGREIVWYRNAFPYCRRNS